MLANSRGNRDERLATYDDDEEEENDVEVDEVDEMVSDVVEGVVDEEVEVEPTEFDVEEGTLPVDGVGSAMVVEVVKMMKSDQTMRKRRWSLSMTKTKMPASMSTRRRCGRRRVRR